jgi:magnesium-transporting ATPase (P-type)
VTIVLGTIFLTESPLNATQLIWINLIMDILGAMALATAPPLASVIHQPAITPETTILSKTIWRQGYGVAVWMVVIMFLIVWFGRTMYDLDYSKGDQTTDTCPGDKTIEACPSLAKKTHMTMIFTTFVFLQFFNMLNCRVIGPSEYNIFKKFFNSIVFILVLCVIFFVQWSACEWFTFIFETATISGEQFGQCILAASTVLIASLALKLTPEQWVEKLPVQIDENEVMGRDSILMKSYE